MRPFLVTCSKRPLALTTLCPLALSTALVWFAAATLLASCGKDEPAATAPNTDAGITCQPGSQGCRCDEANTCDRGLLCSAGRCLPTEGSSQQEPDVRVPVVLPDIPASGGAAGASGADSGAPAPPAGEACDAALCDAGSDASS